MACIKAFTILADYNTTVEINTDKNKILVGVLDQFRNPVLNGRIMVKLDDNDYSFELVDGKVQVPFDIDDGVHNISVYYKGEKYNSSYSNKSFEVLLRMDLAKSNVFTLNSNYKIVLHDQYGNFIANKKVILCVNNSVKLNKFSANKYTVTVNYKGFKVSNKITVKSTLTDKNKSVKKGKTLKFTAKLVNSKGKALKGKKITFKIKNKKYVAKTNKNGIATIKIKNLKIGKHTIKTSYGKVKINNIITVKK